MLTELIIFIILGVVSVGTAVAVVLSKNPIYAVLLLVVNFFTLAMFYLVLSAQFIAFIQVLIYAGAIMVLFLFAVMLLNMTGAIEDVRDELPAQKWLAVIFGMVLLLLAAAALLTGAFKTVPKGGPLPVNFGTSAPIGRLLYTDYLLPFEATSILLLIAMVGSIVLAKRRR
ncbi:MAG: NADH-quinone oxidoreductase subunit J [Armatimonadota bacterium]